MAYDEAWLIDNTARRCILVKVGRYNVGTTAEEFVYLSNAGYMPTTADVEFLPIITGGLKFTETLTLNASPSMSFGDLEINNFDGSYDDWTDSDQFIWTNRSIQIYYGDPSWAASDFAAVVTNFQLIFDGVISDISVKSRDRISFLLRDKLEKLNSPLTEDKLGTFGTWGTSAQSNQTAIKPLVFGEVHNQTPLLVDPSQLQYQVCASNAMDIIEIRDNGVPVYISGSTVLGATITNSTGTIGGTTFKLTASPAGAVTCTVQGVKNYMNLTSGTLVTTATTMSGARVANLIALLATQYGKSYTRLVAADLDLTNLLAYDTANTQPVGLLVSGPVNVIVACQQLATSLGAQINFSRAGKLQLLTLGTPTADASIAITTDDIVANSLSIANRTALIAAAKIGYCKNWTVQTGLLTGIPQAHKDMFAEEWLTVVSTVNSTIQSRYKLTAEPPVQKDTLLLVTADAQTEANRLKTYFSEPHNIYGFKGTPRMQLLKLGQEVTLTHPRFGLASTKTGQVISLSPDWSTGFVDVEVIV